MPSGPVGGTPSLPTWAGARRSSQTLEQNAERSRAVNGRVRHPCRAHENFLLMAEVSAVLEIQKI